MKLTTSLVALLVLVASAYAQAPIQRNPWTTNITGNAVLGANNLIVTNTSAAGTNWVFYGVASNTVARLVDITNVTGNYVLKAGDTMTGSLTTVGLTNTGGFTNSGNAYVSGNVGIGTNGFLPILQVEGNRTGRAFAVNESSIVVTNGNVGINNAVPSYQFDVTGSAHFSSTTLADSAHRTLSGGYFGFATRSRSYSGGNGYWDFYNDGLVDFLGLRFGGLTATYPALFTYTNNATYTTYTIPHLQAKNAAGTGNIPFVALTFIADSTNSAAVGNPRGQGAVDLQAYRSSATAVASGTNSFIGAGTNNTASGWNSAIIGGVGGTASATGSAVVGGSANNISGNYSVGMGVSCTANSTAGLVAGQSCAVQESYAQAFGLSSVAAGTYGFASGYAAKAHLFGSEARASGLFAIAGDAQCMKLVARRSTSTNATPTTTGTTNYWNPLYLDGDAAANRLVLPYTAVTQTNAVWTFKAQIAANATTNYAGTIVNYAAGYTIEGVIKETVVAGTRTTTLVGTPIITVLGEDNVYWDVRATADDTNEALLIEYWSSDDCPRVVATVTLTQVTMAQ